MSKIDPMVYQPFGAGPRNCIGMRFAILEVKMAMCKVLLNFKLEPCVDTPVSAFAYSRGVRKHKARSIYSRNRWWLYCDYLEHSGNRTNYQFQAGSLS